MLYIWYNSRKLSRIKPYFVLLRVEYLTLNKDYLLNGNFGHDYNAFCGFYLEIIVANSFFIRRCTVRRARYDSTRADPGMKCTRG